MQRLGNARFREQLAALFEQGKDGLTAGYWLLVAFRFAFGEGIVRLLAGCRVAWRSASAMRASVSSSPRSSSRARMASRLGIGCS
jgi:hypothetical protein